MRKGPTATGSHSELYQSLRLAYRIGHGLVRSFWIARWEGSRRADSAALPAPLRRLGARNGSTLKPLREACAQCARTFAVTRRSAPKVCVSASLDQLVAELIHSSAAPT
jgi:hypothetical protein